MFSGPFTGQIVDHRACTVCSEPPLQPKKAYPAVEYVASSVPATIRDSIMAGAASTRQCAHCDQRQPFRFLPTYTRPPNVLVLRFDNLRKVADMPRDVMAVTELPLPNDSKTSKPA